ncbi:TIGR03620 family F420-dependent LLM class oxidoreductase [Rhodococcoides kyotonense]|uniref:Probable F420-dependent oxidoreductase, MSMEG_4141 family n=1 Tax=Rhodococcoides kyotonense TaxID=398843 RepID=A0A239ICC7_9NOCA|nr:TIGR03620 family F420-dependent LLM class oxidoreductase [Rhodococcus kyotonensis]SNS90054.1 probable F420-dependent oxidoreductase, MSMEG_4141 family [Rhodococcus kyotonensis]
MDTLGLGRVGIAIDVGHSYLDVACELESLGYTSLWLPGGRIDRLGRLADLVDATASARIVPGIIPVDVFGPEETSTLYDELAASGRFVVGLGGPQAARPLKALNGYLDALRVPADKILLAALGPKKLEVARDRAAGAVALLVTPSYTAEARGILGDAVLAIDQFVVLEDDPAEARAAAREPLSFLATVGGYRQNFLRMGFTSADVDSLSDNLVDAVVAWGSVDDIARRVQEHLDAGADHVVLAPLGTSSLDAGRALAGLVG